MTIYTQVQRKISGFKQNFRDMCDTLPSYIFNYMYSGQ